MQRHQHLLSIKEVRHKLNIPKHTLRFWEKEFDGILVPIRTTRRQRRYTVQNTFIIEEIKRLRKNEMSLTEIKGKLSISGKAWDHSNSKRIDLLANRVADIVKIEVYAFFEGENKWREITGATGPFGQDVSEVAAIFTGKNSRGHWACPSPSAIRGILYIPDFPCWLFFL